MQLKINVPTKANIINEGFKLAVARKGQSWSKSQLGDYADRSGVYVLHSNGKILYVGNTTKGHWGTFGERLRREFQQTSARNCSLFQLLASKKKPIKAFVLDLENIDIMVDPGRMQLSPVTKALIMEQLLIGILEPEGNKRK